MTKHERKLIIEEEAAFHGVTALKLDEPGAMDYNPQGRENPRF